MPAHLGLLSVPTPHRQRSSTAPTGLPPGRLPLVLANNGYVPASRYPVAGAAKAAIAMADLHGSRTVSSKHAARPDRPTATKNKTNCNQSHGLRSDTAALSRYNATHPLPLLASLADGLFDRFLGF
jgi:hypothetical protein